MIAPMRRLLPVVGLLALSTAVLAHEGHTGEHDEDAEKTDMTPEQKDKRLKRIIRRAEQRARSRDQRIKDDRAFLRARLGRQLKGAAPTPAIVEELELHARRIALLRQIHYTAAKNGDFDTVIATDVVLSRENSRHETWW